MYTYILFMFMFFMNGCMFIQMFPHKYETIDDRQWEQVQFKKTGFSLKLPVDDNFKWVLWESSHCDEDRYLLRQELYRITPYSFWESRSLAVLDVCLTRYKATPKRFCTHEDVADSYLHENECNIGIPYKYYFSGTSDSIIYEYYNDIDVNVNLHLWLSVNSIKSMGSSYYKHDPSFPQRLDKIFNRILGSLEYNGRIITDIQPEDRIIHTFKPEKVPEGYEVIFKKFSLY